MAAPRGNVSDSESSSEDSTEELQRCREAAVPVWGWGPNPERGQEVTAKDNLPATRPSLRQKVDDHEQDGNELQTTPEFRAHVAKKLGTFLDSCITISESRPKLTQTPTQTEPPGEDDGFRLFFTSIPGSPKDTGPPAMRRKRPPSTSSGSDSDEEWRRCQEAAVSGTDILRHGALPVREAPEEKQTLKKKKKKKQKQVGQGEEAGPRVTEEKEPERGKAQPNGDHIPLTTKKKKRKKKNQKENSETLPFPPQKGRAACGTE